MKPPPPKSKITVRHRQMRNKFQCFAGRSYITGALGDTASEAVFELVRQYEIPRDIRFTVHGCSTISVVSL